MSDSVSPEGESPSAESQPAESESGSLPAAPWRAQLRPAILSTLVLTVLTGVAFPLVLVALAQVLFPTQAGGSLIQRGNAVGSALIAQEFAGPGYFRPRPSAAGKGYDGTSSGGTNLAPGSLKLRDGAPDDPATPGVDESFAGIRELAEEYRNQNDVPPDALVPVDAVTRSGSGLDPHISPANALLQAARLARTRGLSRSQVLRLVGEHTEGRQFGLLGQPRVNVLELNLALDRAGPTGPMIATRATAVPEP
jgi:K+-transporting ATPase ATPase C chain